MEVRLIVKQNLKLILIGFLFYLNPVPLFANNGVCITRNPKTHGLECTPSSLKDCEDKLKGTWKYDKNLNCDAAINEAINSIPDDQGKGSLNSSQSRCISNCAPSCNAMTGKYERSNCLDTCRSRCNIR